MIDWNVRAGDLLVMASLAGTAFVYAFKSGRFAETIDIMNREIEDLKESMKIIAGAITTVAVQKSQIERIEKDIDDMKRGVGYKQDRIARSVDREY
jgi:uncharacterized protein Yka (UPF0111/DUF47 family)